MHQNGVRAVRFEEAEGKMRSRDSEKVRRKVKVEEHGKFWGSH